MVDFLLPDMSRRSDASELMDDPNSDEKKLFRTIKQFRLINNILTRSKYFIRRYIVGDMLANRDKSYTFLDIGAGGCDIEIWLIQLLRRYSINCKVYCLDYDKRIIDYNRSLVDSYPELEIIYASLFDVDLDKKYDYVFANHFLHHLNGRDIGRAIEIIASITANRFLINDISRSKSAYFGYTLFSGLLFHNSFAFYDGRLSIKKGFTEAELNSILKKISINGELNILKALPSRLCIYGDLD